MKAEELRIGNYHIYHIINNTDDRKEWDQIYITDSHDIEWLSNPASSEDVNYKPIPITKELLFKLGFKEEGDWAVLNFNPRMGIRFLNFNSAECDIIQDGKYIAFKNGHIKYVHQLQNLYFALTGEELKFDNSVKID